MPIKKTPGNRRRVPKVRKGNVQQKATQGQKANAQTQTQPQTPFEENPSLTVDGSPYAPISLRKTIEKLEKDGHFDNRPEKEGEPHISVLLNNSGNGFEIDGAETINVTISERITQTQYFVDEVLAKLPRIPAYLYRYIHWVMFEDCNKPMKYPSDNSYVQALASQLLKQTDEEYQKVYNFIKWGKSNSEALHLVALIQLIGGTMLARSKKNLGCRFFIELPETGFHPKRERLIMTLLYKLQEEYGIKKDWTPT